MNKRILLFIMNYRCPILGILHNIECYIRAMAVVPYVATTTTSSGYMTQPTKTTSASVHGRNQLPVTSE